MLQAVIQPICSFQPTGQPTVEHQPACLLHSMHEWKLTVWSVTNQQLGTKNYQWDKNLVCHWLCQIIIIYTSGSPLLLSDKDQSEREHRVWWSHQNTLLMMRMKLKEAMREEGLLHDWMESDWCMRDWQNSVNWQNSLNKINEQWYR